MCSLSKRKRYRYFTTRNICCCRTPFAFHQIILLLSIFTSIQVSHADVIILLPEKKVPYSQVAVSITQQFKKQHRSEHIQILELSSLSYQPLPQNMELLITLGVDATQYGLSEQEQIPQISGFITHSALHSLLSIKKSSDAKKPDHFLSAVVLDQPVTRYLRAIKTAMPKIQSVGAVLGPKASRLLPDLEQAAKAYNWQLNVRTLSQDEKPLSVLNSIFSSSDVFLVLPDRANFNQQLAKLVIALSNRYRLPVVAYSKGYTNAGALISLYSTPEQIGKQVAQQAVDYLNNPFSQKGDIYAPAEFEISINQSVEAILNTKIQSVQTLTNQLINAESKSQKPVRVE